MAAASNSNQPTTSIFIRDWKVRKKNARSPDPDGFSSCLTRWAGAAGGRGGGCGRQRRPGRPRAPRAPRPIFFPHYALNPHPFHGLLRAAAQLSGRRAFIKYERDDNSFWFNPVVDEHRPSSSTPGFPCNRGDIFLKLGMRGARIIPWRLREGDVFRLGQAYVLVAKVRLAADMAMDVSALSPPPSTLATSVAAVASIAVSVRSSAAVG